MVQRQDRGNLRLQADTETVEDLVAQVLRGSVRVPNFQRPLRWTAENVIQLFDSVYRGYPVGSFLLQKRPAPKAVVRYGPVLINAPELHDALWVVDGQQRLTALAAALARPMPIPETPDDPWVVYFDAASRGFIAPPRDGNVQGTWVPVAALLDSSALSEWVFNWEHGTDSNLRSSVFEAGSKLRQYQIPVYVVETEDEQLLRDIFYRINDSGRPLKWEDIHDALFGNTSGNPSTLKSLADQLQGVGMGRPEEDQLLSCLIAFKGLDVTRSVSEHYRKDPEVLRDAVADALPALHRVLHFFRISAEIPHLRLLPRVLPMVVLTRFFAVFPDPKGRTVELLIRWTWRVLLGAPSFDERTVLRRGVSAINPSDEEGTVQALLSTIPRIRPTDIRTPIRFDARAAESRIALIAMASLGPLNSTDLAPVDIAALIEEKGADAFRQIVPGKVELGTSAANRILLPGHGLARNQLASYLGDLYSREFFKSHGISSDALLSLSEGDASRLLKARQIVLDQALNDLGDRLAGWSRLDRPTISYLLARVG